MKHVEVRKTCGPDGVPIEVWKCLIEAGVEWILMLFNAVLMSVRCQPGGGRVLRFSYTRTKETLKLC